VCPDCVAAGPAGAAVRARAHAERKRRRAEQIEAMADDLPSTRIWASLEDLKAAERRAEEAMVEEDVVPEPADDAGRGRS
jgi:hypothetical protein